MAHRDLCAENRCTRTDAHTHPLLLPSINMRQWEIVWPGQPWIQPVDPNTGLVCVYQTPMCRFCHRLYDHHQPDCVVAPKS